MNFSATQKRLSFKDQKKDNGIPEPKKRFGVFPFQKNFKITDCKIGLIRNRKIGQKSVYFNCNNSKNQFPNPILFRSGIPLEKTLETCVFWNEFPKKLFKKKKHFIFDELGIFQRYET